MSAEVHQYIFAKSTQEACEHALQETDFVVGKVYLVESVTAQQDPSNPKYYATMISLSDRWQPIETAPKDGTKILACNKDCIEIVRWNTFFLEPAGWLVSINGESGFNYIEKLDDATHWMPLPKLPS